MSSIVDDWAKIDCFYS